MSPPLKLSFNDEQRLREVTFTWTKAWDTKDLAAFLSIAAPKVIADYTELFSGGHVVQTDPETLFKGLFNEFSLGHPNLKTQHLLGAARFTRIDGSKAIGEWQVRANHVKKHQDGQLSIWDSSAYAKLTYVIVNGEWKLHAWKPHSVSCEIGSYKETIAKL
ncbi:hypothetical protein COCVIDRAFT_32062 [Bipolaris victoriae FI3]|uniref:Scytalone dehydratase-like domain-containing protein n=1 Tax=Bipolaris victoriae (strain FI3) TaxID=930091 RepID=W7E3J7_BIPV3|nr:hypothetical protein COCVIDRAFT_32062 [Bipolaris victoriae FI3]